MQYMLLIYEDERIYGPDRESPAARERRAQHIAYSRELGPTRLAGSGLKDSTATTTIRTAAGKQTIHDGPFAESREQLGGYYLIDAPDLDAAIAIAKKVPLAQNGAVAVPRSRPCRGFARRCLRACARSVVSRRPAARRGSVAVSDCLSLCDRYAASTADRAAVRS
jgi:hypothetical protein